MGIKVDVVSCADKLHLTHGFLEMFDLVMNLELLWAKSAYRLLLHSLLSLVSAQFFSPFLLQVSKLSLVYFELIDEVIQRVSRALHSSPINK